MAKKTKDQRRAEKTSRIATRGAKRAAGREVRKEQRTERLAARKGISTEQAGQLQANRKQRFKEFAAGGTENITTGRLRFSSDPSGESTPAGGTDPASVAKNDANAAFSKGASDAQASLDRLGGMQDEVTGRGGRAYNKSLTGSVDIGSAEIDPSGFSDKTLKDSGYKSRGSGAYGS